jgi:hypothetical protein
MNTKLTKGNADDRSVVPQMTADGISSRIKASKELFLQLLARGLKLITGIKSNMKNVLILHEKLLLRKRSL